MFDVEYSQRGESSICVFMASFYQCWVGIIDTLGHNSGILVWSPLGITLSDTLMIETELPIFSCVRIRCEREPVFFLKNWEPSKVWPLLGSTSQGLALMKIFNHLINFSKETTILIQLGPTLLARLPKRKIIRASSPRRKKISAAFS